MFLPEASDALEAERRIYISYQMRRSAFAKTTKGNPFVVEENDATEEEVTRERTTRVGRPRGGMKVAARSGEKRRETAKRDRKRQTP